MRLFVPNSVFGTLIKREPSFSLLGRISAMALLQTHNLTKIYGNKHIAVNSMNLTVGEGWVFGLLGPNGAGKTTMMKLLLGLQIPTAGRAEVFGQIMTPNSAHLRQRIGYLPTNPKFPPTMTPLTY